MINKETKYLTIAFAVAGIWAGLFFYFVTMTEYFKFYNPAEKVISSSWIFMTLIGTFLLSKNWHKFKAKEKWIIVLLSSYPILSTLAFVHTIFNDVL